MEEIIVYLQLKIAIPEDKKVSVSSIAKAVDESDLDKHVLRQILEAIQEDEVLRLCGDKYATLLMIKGIKTPYSSNIIERLMGEIAKRVKNKWMHWSTRGLEAIINLILVRYTSEATYEKFYREVQGLGQDL